MVSKISLLIVVLSLLGTMTNLVYISALSSALALILIPLAFAKKQHNIPKFLFYLWCFTLYSFTSVVLYYPASFIDFMFYRYDGNFFISYLPLLVFPFFTVKFNIEKYLNFFLYTVCIINIILYIGYFVTSKGGVLFAPTSGGNASNIFNPLFRANNAAGGFYSILFSVALSFYLNKKKKIYLVFMVFSILFLWGTVSRGSILGLFCGSFCYYLYIKRKMRYLYIIIGTIILTQTIIIYNTYPYYKTYLSGGFQNIRLKDDFNVENTKDANVYIRAYETWPRAVYVFLNSPVFGAGFGSVNDKPFKFSAYKGFISFNQSDEKIFSDSHAHHSFLHILAEEGVVGLGLFLLFWIGLFKHIVSRKRKFPDTVRVFLIIAFLNLTIMSFTEHRITTPSNVLPFVLILVLALMYDNSQNRLKL